METIEYRTKNRTGWGHGPWDTEPDKVQWPDAVTGLPCLAVRSDLGNWCGYVGVSPDHPDHGKGYDDVDVEIHGGLTFAAGCGHSDNESEGICHVPAKTYKPLPYVRAECAGLAAQVAARRMS
jgi:hypothetical protein